MHSDIDTGPLRVKNSLIISASYTQEEFPLSGYKLKANVKSGHQEDKETDPYQYVH